jgi:transcriptional regulator with XRE-family HTH domain
MAKDQLSVEGYLPSLGELLGSAREKYGFTKKEMAEKFGFDESTYGRLENGKTRKMNSKEIEKLKQMAPYIGVPYSELLAAAGLSSEMKREVLYDFDGSEIDYASAVKFLYKADPKLFSYAESIGKMPLKRIKLLEKMIEMFLDSELEKDPSKKLIADNITNNLELYGMRSGVNRAKAALEEWGLETRNNYGFRNNEVFVMPSKRPLSIAEEYERMAAYEYAVVKTKQPRGISAYNANFDFRNLRFMTCITFEIDSRYKASIQMHCQSMIDEDEIMGLMQGFSNVHIIPGVVMFEDASSGIDEDENGWDVNYIGTVGSIHEQEAYFKVQELISHLKKYGGGTVTLSDLGRSDLEMWGVALGYQRKMEQIMQQRANKAQKENSERISQMEK